MKIQNKNNNKSSAISQMGSVKGSVYAYLALIFKKIEMLFPVDSRLRKTRRKSNNKHSNKKSEANENTKNARYFLFNKKNVRYHGI